MIPTLPAWLRSICRRILATAPAANVNPNPPPKGPPPVSQTRPGVAPASPDTPDIDLTFVGTRDMFTAIAARYDACVIVCVRHSGRDDGSCSAVFLAHDVEQPAGFLRSAAVLAEESQIREIREGDL